MWDVINHPCPNFNGGLDKPLLKLGMDEQLHPTVLYDVITYPFPNLEGGLANLC